MSLIVSRIVGGVNEWNSIVNNVCVDDWTTEMSTTASNEFKQYKKANIVKVVYDEKLECETKQHQISQHWAIKTEISEFRIHLITHSLYVIVLVHKAHMFIDANITSSIVWTDLSCH